MMCGSCTSAYWLVGELRGLEEGRVIVLVRCLSLLIPDGDWPGG